MKKRSLFSLFLFVFIDVLGFSIILPLMPYLSKSYQLTPLQVGLLQSSNALAQLIAVPFIGSLSDQHGKQPLLLLCVSATLISFIILALSNSIFWLFFSRILDGLVGGNISLAQAYISDITPEHERSQGLGVLGAGFGLGFIVGPALGGILVMYDEKYPVYMAIVLTAINLIGVSYLPESLPVYKRGKDFDSIVLVFRKLWTCLKQEQLALILLMRFIYLIVFTIFECGFGYFNKQLGITVRASSYLLCYYGFVFAFIQGGLRYLIQRSNENNLFNMAILIQVVFYILHGMCTDYKYTLITLAFLGLSSGLLQTLITSRVSRHIEPALVGGALGVSAALGSLARIIAPPLSGVLIDEDARDMQYAIFTPFLLCGVLSVLMLWLEHKLSHIIK